MITDETLGQVLPRKAQDNHLNCSRSYAITRSDCSSIAVPCFLSGVHFPNRNYVTFFKLGRSLSLSARPIFAMLYRTVAMFGAHIMRVVFLCTCKQMGRIHASGCVAGVAYIQPDRQCAMSQKIGNSVCESFLTVDSKHPVTVAVASSVPEPATFRFIKILFKTANVLSGKLDAVKRVAYALVSFFHIFGMIGVRAGMVATTISSLAYYKHWTVSCKPNPV